MMMSCRRATRLLSEAQERKLSFGERASLKFHTSMCSGCRYFGRQIQALRDISRAYARGANEESPDKGDQSKRGDS